MRSYRTVRTTFICCAKCSIWILCVPCWRVLASLFTLSHPWQWTGYGVFLTLAIISQTKQRYLWHGGEDKKPVAPRMVGHQKGVKAKCMCLVFLHGSLYFDGTNSLTQTQSYVSLCSFRKRFNAIDHFQWFVSIANFFRLMRAIRNVSWRYRSHLHVIFARWENACFVVVL